MMESKTKQLEETDPEKTQNIIVEEIKKELISNEPKRIDLTDEQINEYREQRKPVNSNIPVSKDEDISNLIKTIASDLVFFSIPPKDDPDYKCKLSKFENILQTQMKNHIPSIEEVSIIRHECEEEKDRGSMVNDRFFVSIKTKDYTKLVSILFTNTNTSLVKKIKENLQREENRKEINSLFDEYFDISHAESPKNKSVIFEEIIEKIDKKYAPYDIIGEKCNYLFFERQIDLLIKKIKTLEPSKETFMGTSIIDQKEKNYYALLKYFIIKYLKSIYNGKYKDVE